MAEFTLSEIISATQGTAQEKIYQKNFNDVSTDTRTLKKGCLFIALTGKQFDGHNFLFDAAAKGAAALVVSRDDVPLPEGVTIIHVKDTLKALQDIANCHRQRFFIPVIAVTGSNGKTTTKDMVSAVLSSHFNVLKTEANYNNEIGLPQTLLRLNSAHDLAVVEMGMRAQGEIRELANIALPTIAIVTNVSETHIELLGTIDNIAKAKAELVEAIPAEGLIFLNADNSYVKSMAEKALGKVILYGLSKEAAVRAENIYFDGTSTIFDCIYSRGKFQVSLPAIGRHNVLNALAAIAVGLELGLSAFEIVNGLIAFAPGKMRLNIEKIKGCVVINDCYNASPLSTAAAIDTLADVAQGRTIAVLGDMLELGHYAVEAHQKMGMKLAERKVNAVVTVGPLAQHIAASARTAGVDLAISCANHQEAVSKLNDLVKPGDTILIKGSRGMKMEKIIDMWH